MGTQLRSLLIANGRMFYRSLDNVLFVAFTPLVMLAGLALVQRLEFTFARRTGSVGFFAFVAIGFAAFMAAHLNQDGIVGAASGYRAQGVLKRIAVTPISARTFIAAQVLVRLLVGFLETLVFLAAAVALGLDLHYTAEMAWTLPLATITLLTGTGFGFAIAGIVKSPEAANQLNIALFTPVMVLGGIQYPLQGLPGALPHVAEYVVPFAAPVQAFREAIAGHLAGDFPRLLVLSLAWLVVALALAVRSYKLVERDA